MTATRFGWGGNSANSVDSLTVEATYAHGHMSSAGEEAEGGERRMGRERKKGGSESM